MSKHNYEDFYNSAKGNLSLYSAQIALTALAAGDTISVAGNVPVGTQFFGVRNVTPNLGVNTAVEIILVRKDGSEKTLHSVDTTTADARCIPIMPEHITDGVAKVLLKNAGTAAASGEVSIHLEYRATNI